MANCKFVHALVTFHRNPYPFELMILNELYTRLNTGVKITQREKLDFIKVNKLKIIQVELF